MRRYILWAILTFALVLALYGTDFRSRIWAEAGLRTLVHASMAAPRSPDSQAILQAKDLLQRAVTWDQNNPGAHRGLGFVYWYQDDDDHAFEEWQQAGLTASDFIALGEQSHPPDQALRWYKLAERLEPANQSLWLQAGKICQVQPEASDICTRFLVYNDYNWLVDPDFVFGQAAWRFNRREGVIYRIGKCPGLPGENCATLIIGDIVPPKGASWQQCVALEPGQEYVFSAWIKVDALDEVRWRPLYYQGSLEGEAWGRSRGHRSGSVDWHYEEHSFVAPDFDEHRACFHPVHLQGRGQIWFYEASLWKRQ